MTIGVPKESFPGERRVALIPASVTAIIKAGLEIIIETGSGDEAGYKDSSYLEKGARVVKNRKELFNSSDIILQVRAAGANPEAAHVHVRLRAQRGRGGLVSGAITFIIMSTALHYNYRMVFEFPDDQATYVAFDR